MKARRAWQYSDAKQMPSPSGVVCLYREVPHRATCTLIEEVSICVVILLASPTVERNGIMVYRSAVRHGPRLLHHTPSTYSHSCLFSQSMLLIIIWISYSFGAGLLFLKFPFLNIITPHVVRLRCHLPLPNCHHSRRCRQVIIHIDKTCTSIVAVFVVGRLGRIMHRPCQNATELVV